MRKLKSKRRKNILLYSTILSLIVGSNSFAIAKDVTVSSGDELKKVIQEITAEPTNTNIYFANDIDISGKDITVELMLLKLTVVERA